MNVNIRIEDKRLEILVADKMMKICQNKQMAKG